MLICGLNEIRQAQVRIADLGGLRDFIRPTRGWLNPTAFIQQHRGAPEDDVGRIELAIGRVSPTGRQGTARSTNAAGASTSTHNALKVSPVREQINPVQCEQSDN